MKIKINEVAEDTKKFSALTNGTVFRTKLGVVYYLKVKEQHGINAINLEDNSTIIFTKTAEVIQVSATLHIDEKV